jgi:hypothetical protein
VTDQAQIQFSIGWAIMADLGGNGGFSLRVPDGSDDKVFDINISDGELTVGPFTETGNPEISAVYYLDGDFRDLVSADDEEFVKLAENAVLLWER